MEKSFKSYYHFTAPMTDNDTIRNVRLWQDKNLNLLFTEISEYVITYL